MSRLIFFFCGSVVLLTGILCRSKLIPTLFMHYDLELEEPEKEWETSCWWFVMQKGLHVRLQERTPVL